MDLDRRAAEAAHQLRTAVAEDLDVDAALDRVAIGAGRRRSRATGVRVAAVAFVALSLLGALAAAQAQGGGGSDGEQQEATGPDGNGMVGAGGDARAAQILGGLPAGPVDGRESWRLPLVAEPNDQLAVGQEVMLVGRGFEPGELVGAVHCASEADTSSAGVGACDLGDGFSNTVQGNARSDGSVVLTVPIRRFIDTPALGPVDCASAPERCLLAIGAANNYDRSGGAYVNLAGSPPFPEPTLTVSPEGPYQPGQEVAVTAGGSIAGRQAQILQCAGEDQCAPLSRGRVAADGTYAASVAVGNVVVVDGVSVSCDDAPCTLVFTGIGPEGRTSQPFPPPYPIEVLPGDVQVGGGDVGGASGSADPGTAQPPTTDAPGETTTTTVIVVTPGPETTEPTATTAPPATTGPPATVTSPAPPTTG